MKNLNFWDVVGIAVCWTGAAAIVYATKSNTDIGFIALVCVIAAIYLARLIIIKKD